MISRKNKVKLVLEGKKIILSSVCGRASVFSYFCLFCFFNQSATRSGLLMLASYLGILSRQCHYVLKLELNLSRLLSARCCWEKGKQLDSSCKKCVLTPKESVYRGKIFSFEANELVPGWKLVCCGGQNLKMFKPALFSSCCQERHGPFPALCFLRQNRSERSEVEGSGGHLLNSKQATA